VSRRYVAVLAVIAALVLSVGLVTRRMLEPHDAPSSAPPSQAAALQQLSQEGQLRRSATYVAERVAASAEHVEFVPASGASGVRWRRDSVLTTDRGHIVRAEARAPDSIPARLSIAADSVRREWLLVVARDASERVLSAAVLAGGRTTVRCGARPVERYVLGTQLDEQFAGAGIFTVDGALLGMAAWCDGRLVAVPLRQLIALLATRDSQPTRESPAGFTVAVGDTLARRYVGSDSALLVTTVRRGSAADAMGLRAGDLLVAVNDVPLRADAVEPLGGVPIERLTVLRRRGRTIVRANLVAVPVSPFGVRPEQARDAGVALSYVAPGSVAQRAGLRAGDRLLRVGNDAVSSAADASRLLGQASQAKDGTPVLVAFERDGVEHAVLLPTSPVTERAAP
jgi:hypothetical protein